MMALLVALFVAVFVLIPTVDAAACAVELDPAHVVASVDGDDGDASGDTGDHALCSHGHCHHGGASLPSSVPSAVIHAAVAPSVIRPSEPMASRVPGGPERPPRA